MQDSDVLFQALVQRRDAVHDLLQLLVVVGNVALADFDAGGAQLLGSWLG